MDMLKIRWVILFMLGLLLAACRGGTPAVVEEPTQLPPADTPEPVSAPVFMTTCTLVSAMPTPSPEELSMFPPITADEHSLGPENATVTIIEYSDFQ
jgi:hypothetical protein